MNTAWRVAMAQVAAGCCAAALWSIRSFEAACAAAGGAAAVVLPTLYMAWRMHRAFGVGGARGGQPDSDEETERRSRAIWRSVFVGAVGKWVLTGAMFAMVIIGFPNEFLPVITASFAALAMYWPALLADGTERDQAQHGHR